MASIIKKRWENLKKLGSFLSKDGENSKRKWCKNLKNGGNTQKN